MGVLVVGDLLFGVCISTLDCWKPPYTVEARTLAHDCQPTPRKDEGSTSIHHRTSMFQLFGVYCTYETFAQDIDESGLY